MIFKYVIFKDFHSMLLPSLNKMERNYWSIFLNATVFNNDVIVVNNAASSEKCVKTRTFLVEIFSRQFFDVSRTEIKQH